MDGLRLQVIAARFVGSVLLAMLIACASAHSTPLSVRTVIDDRSNLGGRTVLIRGFLARVPQHERTLYLLRSGVAKPQTDMVREGEAYWCSDEIYPVGLWFTSEGLRDRDQNVEPRILELPGYPEGQLVLVRATLHNETPVHPTPDELEAPLGFDRLVLEQVGPLSDVEILHILPDRCD